MLMEGFGEIAEKLRRSTVQVKVGRRGHGSGIIVKPEGLIVTNAHVAASTPLEVHLWDGTSVAADLELRDVTRDLAILRVFKSALPAAGLADSSQVRVGEPVIAIGNPWGFLGALTAGVVCGIGRVPGLGMANWIQSNVQLAPGNSGGPLASAQGVVGINTMIAGRVGLAVPSNNVRRLLEGRLSRAPLGVVVRPVAITVTSKERLGLVVLEIVRNSAAEMASLMVGDILIGVDGKDLNSLEDFEEALVGAGERLIRLQFLRGDRTHVRTVAVRLGAPNTAAA
jgi:serine protease Do